MVSKKLSNNREYLGHFARNFTLNCLIEPVSSTLQPDFITKLSDRTSLKGNPLKKSTVLFNPAFVYKILVGNEFGVIPLRKYNSEWVDLVERKELDWTKRTKAQAAV